MYFIKQMAGWFRCPRHGRFPINKVAEFATLTDQELFLEWETTTVVPCPKCGEQCKQCMVNRGAKLPVEE